MGSGGVCCPACLPGLAWAGRQIRLSQETVREMNYELKTFSRSARPFRKKSIRKMSYILENVRSARPLFLKKYIRNMSDMLKTFQNISGGARTLP